MDRVTAISWLWTFDAIGWKNWPLLELSVAFKKKKKTKKNFEIFSIKVIGVKVFNIFFAKKVLKKKKNYDQKE